MKKIGFIGIGVMGAPMAGHLLKAGYDVAVYARRKEAADALVSQGAEFCSSIAQCAKGRDAVITMVGFPKDVEEVYFGEQGILQNASTGTILIDMTTTSPRLSLRIAQDVYKRQPPPAALPAKISKAGRCQCPTFEKTGRHTIRAALQRPIWARSSAPTPSKYPLPHRQKTP